MGRTAEDSVNNGRECCVTCATLSGPHIRDAASQYYSLSAARLLVARALSGPVEGCFSFKSMFALDGMPTSERSKSWQIG